MDRPMPQPDYSGNDRIICLALIKKTYGSRSINLKGFDWGKNWENGEKKGRLF
jgi:hypothetical protein